MRRFLIAALPLVALIAVPGQAVNEEELPEETLLREADAHIENGDNAEALVKIDMAIGLFNLPEESKKFYFCVNDLTQVLRTSAIRVDASIVSRTLCDAYMLKAFVLSNMERQAEAGVALQKAVAMAPLNVNYINTLAEWHYDNGDWQRALDTFRQAISTSSFTPLDTQKGMRAWSLRGIGLSLSALKQMDAAEAAFRESLELEPDHNVAVTALSSILALKHLRAEHE